MIYIRQREGKVESVDVVSTVSIEEECAHSHRPPGIQAKEGHEHSRSN